MTRDPLDEATVLLETWLAADDEPGDLFKQDVRRILELTVDAAVQRMRAELFADETPPESPRD